MKIIVIIVNKCVWKHSGNFAGEKKHSANIALHVTANDERQLQLLKIQSDDNSE